MAMPRQIVVDLVEGDDAPEWPVRFKDLDLAYYATITMHVQKEGTEKFSREVIPDGADSELGWVVWQPGDLTRGRHKAEFEFLRSLDSKRFTLPRSRSIILNVRADLG